MLTIILLVAAAVLFGLAAFGIGGRINLVALGLLLLTGALLIPEVS